MTNVWANCLIHYYNISTSHTLRISVQSGGIDSLNVVHFESGSSQVLRDPFRVQRGHVMPD